MNSYGVDEQPKQSDRITLVSATKSVLANFVKFSGRAPRAEFWYWNLAVVLVGIPVFFGSIWLEPIVGYDAAFGVWAVFRVIVIVPTASVMVRRLHDTDRSGYWALLWLIPFLSFVPLIFTLQRGTPGQNRFG